MQYIDEFFGMIFKNRAYSIVITVILAIVVYKVITILLEKAIYKGKNVYEKKKRMTITNLFKNVTKYVIAICAVLAVLSIYGINIKTMVAGLGLTATIIGLALQDTFKDIINGINIIVENYFIVGDIVTYNDFTGTVKEFGLKTTKIKNANGEMLIIANRNIMEIKNLSQKEQIVTINIPIAYKEKIEKVEKVINEKIIPAIDAIEEVNPNSTKYLGINEMADSCLKYLLKFECQRDTQWQARRDANKIILNALAAEKISIPYPQLEVHNEK